MPPAHALSAIVALTNYWIRYNNIVSVIAIAHFKQDEGKHLFKGLIARSVITLDSLADFSHKEAPKAQKSAGPT
jgi:hypothetical protein